MKFNATVMQNKAGLTVQEAIDRIEAMPGYNDQIMAKPFFVSQENQIYIDRPMRDPLRIQPESKALGQILARVGLPQHLGPKALAIGAADELTEMMNKALRLEPKDFLFRSVGQETFAAMSPSYKRMDTRLMFPEQLRRLDLDTNWRVAALNLQPGLSSLMAVAWDRARPIQRDDLVPGLRMFNGDDGGSKWAALAAIWRVVCGNGMTTMLAEMVNNQRVHRGARQRIGYLQPVSLETDAIDCFPDEEGVFRAFASSLEGIERAMDTRVPGLEAEYLAGMGSILKLAPKETEAMASKTTAGFQGTVWDFTNRMTELARDLKKNERAKALEGQAWEYLGKAAGPTETERMRFNAHLLNQGRLVMTAVEK